jgi:hypothetical protein
MLRKMLKEVVVAHFEVLFQNLTGITQEKKSTSEPLFELRTS